MTSLDVERLKLELKRGTNKQGRPFTQATIKHQLVLLNRLYNLAKRWGLYTGENPMDRVEMPRLDNQVTEFLDDDQLARLMATLDAWHCQDTVNFIKFAMLTGLRRGELFKLTWDDIDFQRGLLTLRQPKGGKSEIIPISNEAMNVLRRQDASSMYIFFGKDGEQRTDFKGPWQRIRKAAGLPDNFRFHGLRHHFASTLISNGVDLAVVRGLLTHKDARTSLRYAHLQPDAMKQAALQSGKLLQPKGKQAKKVASIGKGKRKD
ncbi:MAG: tyrosine-type recombinase/integrase [Syntrophobacteraceae bacterium]